jgi:hypothetical protein
VTLRRAGRIRSSGPKVGAAELAVAAQLVIARSRDRCEICGDRGQQISHRRAQGTGGVGRKAVTLVQTAANLMRLCAGCHHFVEMYADAARLLGWRISKLNATPADHVHVWCQPGQPGMELGWYLLNDEGDYLAPPPGALEAPLWNYPPFAGLDIPGME